jgi:hypothetical protein
MKTETLRFPDHESREKFINYQRQATWQQILRSTDGITVTIKGITVAQTASALDTYNAIKL